MTEWYCLCGLQIDKPRSINVGPKTMRVETQVSQTVTFTSREPWATSLLLHIGPRKDADLWIIIEDQVWRSTFRVTEVQGTYGTSGTEADVTLLMTREMERA